jgi:site-specific DNA recombinase
MARRRPHKDFSDLSDKRAALYCRVSYIGKRDKNGDEDRRAADEKSVDDQEAEGTAWARRAGADLVRVFTDPGLSASQFATKERPGFRKLLAAVEAGEIDVVWVWAIDRSQRDLRVFTELRDLFQRQQVALSVNGRLHDPNIYDDWMMLGFTSMFGERYSVELSKNVRRGQKSAAADGAPHGPIPYGYKRTRAQNRPEGLPADRVWMDSTKLFVWQEPDLWDGDEQAVDRSPAWVVREIYRRAAAGDSLGAIARDLNDRGIPLPRGGNPGPRNRWTNTQIKRIALNPAYLGLRVYQHDWAGEGWAKAHKSVMPVPGKWPPLVGEEQFWQVHRLLTDPARKTDRPYAAKSLLSCLVTCAKCGGEVAAAWTGRNNGTRYNVYACGYRRCASISRERLDDYVEEVMVKFLSDPDVYAELTRVDNSADADQARADADQARAELAQVFADLEAGLVSARAATIEERRLTEVITEAEQRARKASAEPVLAGHAGPGAEAAWGRASLEVKRQIIRRVADIRLKPAGVSAGNARWYGMPMSARVEWHPLLGPGGGEAIPAPAPPGPRILASEARALTALAQDGPLLLTELDRRLAMGRGSVERVVKRMRGRGWVTSELAPRNGARGRR